MTAINTASLLTAYIGLMGSRYWTGQHLQRDVGIAGALLLIAIVLAVVMFA